MALTFSLRERFAFAPNARTCCSKSATSAASSGAKSDRAATPRTRRARIAAERARRICLDNRRMDVTFAADGFSISQTPCNLFDRLDNVSFDLRFDSQSAQSRSAWAAIRVPAQVRKSLDAKFCAGDLAQIFIDIARFNGNRRARLVDILEQFVTWSFAILRRFDLREKKHSSCSQSKKRRAERFRQGSDAF